MTSSWNLDFNIVLAALTSIVTAIGVVISWFCVRPANRKLAQIESDLQRNNESLASMRNAMLGSSIRVIEVTHARLVESCEAIYRSFMKTYSASAGLLLICASLRDLDEIRKTLQDAGKLIQFQGWLDLFVKDEMLVPIQHDDLSVAEIFVPDRIWRLYSAANSLHASAIIQMVELKKGLDVQLVRREEMYTDIDQLLPGQKEFLDRFGTNGYRTSMGLIKSALLNEIRAAVKSEPISASGIVAMNNCIERAVQIPDVPNDLKSIVAPPTEGECSCGVAVMNR